MAETLIARTFAEGLRPLGAAGQRNHALVTDAVASRLSSAHALLFSEPSPTPDGVAVDWYAPIEGPVRRLDELNAEEQENLRGRIAGLTRDILQFAEELKATGQEADRRLAEALENALEVPDGGAIWLIGEQPVLVNWAHSRDIDKAPRGVIRRLAPAPARPAVAPPPPVVEPPPVPVAAVRRTPWDMLWWFGWLLLAALMLWALYLLIAPCELRGPGFLRFGSCPVAKASPVAEETARQAVLEQQVAALQRELALAGGACVAQPEPEPESMIRAVLGEGGKIGKVNVILSWEGRSDLDLHVKCPSGATISFRNKTACGGELDVDANANQSRMMPNPVENITFAEEPAPGAYQVEVKLHKPRGMPRDETHAFSLLIVADGRETVQRGMVRKGRPWTTSFDYRGSQ